MSKQACALCVRDPAAGFATINDERYCHGDFDPDPTCYMRRQSRLSPTKNANSGEDGFGGVLTAKASPRKDGDLQGFYPTLAVWLKAAADYLEAGHPLTVRKREQLVRGLREAS